MLSEKKAFSFNHFLACLSNIQDSGEKVDSPVHVPKSDLNFEAELGTRGSSMSVLMKQLRHKDPKTKKNSPCNGRSRLFMAEKFNRKCKWPVYFYFSGVGDNEDILMFHCLPKSQTVNTEYYYNLMCLLKDGLKEKRRW